MVLLRREVAWRRAPGCHPGGTARRAADQRRRRDVAAARRRWRDTQPLHDARGDGFVGESGVTADLLRRYGRSPRGVRLHDYTPCGRWQTHTIIAALRVEGLQAPAVFDGPLDNPTFMVYVEQNQAQLFEEDEPAARAEWLAEFRKDFESYISREEGTESSDGPRRRPVRRRGEGATKRTGQRAAQG